MDGLWYILAVVSPLLAAIIKYGIMFSVWGLVIALSRLVQAETRYINAKTFNEVNK